MTLFILAEWVQRDKQHALQIDGMKIPSVVRWSAYYAIIIVAILLDGQQQEFIYFQF